MTKPTLEPYPGLRPYREDEQDKFFGRDADKHVLIDKILNNRLTLLFAASGVGKSSLLQASIIPYLKAEQGENLAVVYYLDWVSEPIHHLRQAIWLALQTEGLLAADSETEGSTLGEALEFCSLFVRHPLVLILDQFEEFFRYQAPQQRQTFISQLTSIITNPQLPVSLVISMREDFALELNAFKPRLPTILFENFYRLEKLERVATEQALVQPVAGLGFAYEPTLLSALLNDLLSRELDRNPHTPVAELRMHAEPPYLQIVCAHLWQLNQNDPEKKLRLNTYEQAGRAKGILENYIKGILQPLSRPEKDLASQAFDHLVGQRGVKKAYTATALASILQAKEAAVQKLLEALEQARILRKQQRGEETWYELYHDMFSSSLEAWNLAWKEQMRRRRLFKGGLLGLSALAAVVLSWDFYINYTSYHLRLSPQAGISDRIELWQGKLNSWDLFRQQRYLAETDFERGHIEPDKQFAKQQLLDLASLQLELIGFQPNEQRIESYTKAGEHSKALATATDMLLHKNQALAMRASQPLFTIRVTDTINKVKEVLAKSESSSVKESISVNTDGTNIPLSFTRLALDQGFDKSNEYQNKIFKHAIINRQLPTELTIPVLIEALKDNDIYFYFSAAMALGQIKADSAIPALINALNDNERYVRAVAAKALGSLKVDSAIPVLINALNDNKSEVRYSAAKALGSLKADSAIPALINALNDNKSEIRSSAATALGSLKADSAIPDLIDALKDNDTYVRYSAAEALGKIPAKEVIALNLATLAQYSNYLVNNTATASTSHLEYAHLKVDFYSDLDRYFEHISEISGAELIDLTLRKLSSIEDSDKALRAALKLKNNGYLNSTQIKIIDKALSQIDPELIQAAEQSIAKEKQELAEEEKSRRPINQPYPETKPLSLDELKAKLNQLDQDYAEWRKQRDTETPAKTTNEPAEDSEAKKLKNLEREVYLYNYTFAIARMDQESGIELLKHNLFKVRQAAASGLVNSDQFTPQLLASLEQQWLATQDPIIRQSLYHAIDTCLLVLEGLGGQVELDFLQAYQPKLTDSASLASIQPRAEWTIRQLQWRMDQVKDLEQLGKDQEPELLERYCLNPDGSDKKPEECTMRPY